MWKKTVAKPYSKDGFLDIYLQRPFLKEKIPSSNILFTHFLYSI